MRAIVNADKNWGIGCENKLLVHIPSDMRFFRDHTTNNVVVMGRKTLESLPGGRPLADRDNIILSRDPGLRVKGAAVVHDVEELQALLSDIHTDRVYVIGGEEIYRLLLPLCDTQGGLCLQGGCLLSGSGCGPRVGARRGERRADLF